MFSPDRTSLPVLCIRVGLKGSFRQILRVCWVKGGVLQEENPDRCYGGGSDRSGTPPDLLGWIACSLRTFHGRFIHIHTILGSDAAPAIYGLRINAGKTCLLIVGPGVARAVPGESLSSDYPLSMCVTVSVSMCPTQVSDEGHIYFVGQLDGEGRGGRGASKNLYPQTSGLLHHLVTQPRT